MTGPALRVFVEGIGVWSPGLTGWDETRAVLQGITAFAPLTTVLPTPEVLPPAERRRSPATAKVALQVAVEACTMAATDPAQLRSVFASSHGDTEITDYMCRELATAQPLSPTRFHNSVHNAASGYWTIAMGCRQSSIAISAGHLSFGYGLLEAAVQAVSSGLPNLLVAYDHAAPAPLSTVCAISRTFGVALVLSPSESARSVVRLEGWPDASSAPGAIALPPGMDALLAGNPAARALPLLSCIATGSSARLDLPPFHWETAPCR